MSVFEEYLSQASVTRDDEHYDKHTDRWVDEAKESVYGHSGHVDTHTDCMR